MARREQRQAVESGEQALPVLSLPHCGELLG